MREKEQQKGAPRAPILQERETGLEPATACLEGRNSTKSALRASLEHITTFTPPTLQSCLTTHTPCKGVLHA